MTQFLTMFAVNSVTPKAAAKHHLLRGGRYLTGENLEVVWAEFSTLS